MTAARDEAAGRMPRTAPTSIRIEMADDRDSVRALDDLDLHSSMDRYAPSMPMSSPAIETSLSFSPAVALDHHGLGG